MMKHAMHLNPSAALSACKASSVSSFAVYAVRYFGVLRYYFYYFFASCFHLKESWHFENKLLKAALF